MNTPRNTVQIEIAPLAERHLPVAAELSQAVQWPHRLEDWQFVHALGDGVAAVAGGRLVGTAMAWQYERTVARIGMVLVDPTIQRAGIGGKLMDALLGRVTAPVLVLNATEAGQPLYRRMGFQPTATIRQHQGIATSPPKQMALDGACIRKIATPDLPQIAELDAAAMGVRRPHVIEALMKHGDGAVLAVGSEIAGFAFCRRFGRGQVLGPVVARDAQASQALMAHWIGVHAGSFVRADVPADSDLSSWLDGCGLVQCSEVQTMSRGTPPTPSGEFKTFALVNQAVG